MPNVFKNAQGIAAATATSIYTAPAATQSVIHAVYLSNVDGVNSINVTLEVTDTSAGQTRKVLYLVPIPANSTLVLDKPINLEATDILKVTASTASMIEVFASVLEIT